MKPGCESKKKEENSLWVQSVLIVMSVSGTSNALTNMRDFKKNIKSLLAGQLKQVKEQQN